MSRVHCNSLAPSVSAPGQKQTLKQFNRMSALRPKADIDHNSRNVGFVPKANMPLIEVLEPDCREK
jgi:hypothetical protein